ISGAIWTSCCCSDVLVVPVRNVGMIATRNDPPQISRTASAAEAAWTTVNPSASSARVISSRSVLISLTIRTEDIGDLTTRKHRDRSSMPPEWAAFFPHAAYQVQARLARERHREFIDSRANAALRGVDALVSSAPWPGGHGRKDWLLSPKNQSPREFGQNVSGVAPRSTRQIWTPTSGYAPTASTTFGCR